MKTNLLLILSYLFSTSLFSQQCTNDSLTLVTSTDVSYSQSGFIDPNLLPCIPSGQYTELIIPFKAYNQGARLLTLADSSTVPVSHIYSLKVESISNLPTGLCWIAKPGNGVITGDQAGAIIVKGTTSASSGTYPISVAISIDTHGSGSYSYTGLLPSSYKDLLGQVVLKIMGSDNNCPTVTY